MGTNGTISFEAQIKRAANTVKEQTSENGDVVARWIETQVTLVSVDEPELAALQRAGDLKITIAAKQLSLKPIEEAKAFVA